MSLYKVVADTTQSNGEYLVLASGNKAWIITWLERGAEEVDADKFEHVALYGPEDELVDLVPVERWNKGEWFRI